MSVINQKLGMFLHLLKENIIPLSVLPEIGLFLTHKKEYLRLTLKNEDFAEVYGLMNQHKINISSKKIYSIYQGNTWYDIKFEDQLKNSDKVNTEDSRILTCYTFGDKDPSIVLEAEQSGRIDEAGRLLGYPKCCIDAVDELNKSGHKWPLLLFNRTSGRPNGYANRLASVWGGTSFTGELFPCSLNCSHAIELGINAEKALWELGLNRLSREIQYMSQRPVLINRTTGDVVALEVFNIDQWDKKGFVPVFFK